MPTSNETFVQEIITLNNNVYLYLKLLCLFSLVWFGLSGFILDLAYWTVFLVEWHYRTL